MFGNVNESGTNMLGRYQWCTIQTKKVRPCNDECEDGPELSSRIMTKGDLSVIFGDVNESGTDMPGSTNGSVLATMNANTAQKSSRFKGMLSP